MLANARPAQASLHAQILSGKSRTVDQSGLSGLVQCPHLATLDSAPFGSVTLERSQIKNHKYLLKSSIFIRQKKITT
ncbi:hypothetical protein Y032_0164g3560 [Ancylostoma ceylanicum]|uniref:Uncharacterized protein n=1 Tax=Ancylostoma ceylanicum TaxID=53326 RepID=A0A016SX96_9BILA|nr:hypothetical protein Y032_0164g3560 [Ancylostoma ceylanicum]